MVLYDAVKDAIKLAQKADNIELYRQLIDISAQVIDLQAEIVRLREENARLKDEVHCHKSIVRHNSAYITLEDDDKQIPYCAICYGTAQKLIQLVDYDKSAYYCYNCKSHIDK